MLASLVVIAIYVKVLIMAIDYRLAKEEKKHLLNRDVEYAVKQ